MHERSTNRFAYVTLIGSEIDPARPEILLEVGMERPVDWDAGDEHGVICGRLDFLLTIGGAGILCALDRVHRDYGKHGHLYVYVLVLRPAPDAKGRPVNAIALDTAGREAKSRGRNWHEDVETVRVSWRHAPESVAEIDNGAFVPEAQAGEAPRATDEEVRRMCEAFDAFCEEADPVCAPCIELGDDDLEEFSLDHAVIESGARTMPHVWN